MPQESVFCHSSLSMVSRNFSAFFGCLLETETPNPWLMFMTARSAYQGVTPS
jgi:hypothetical protein